MDLKIKCGICGKPELDEFVDGVMTIGKWANMCMRCWGISGIGRLGTGLGQRYVWHENARKYTKVEG